jgi:hypothetical protein
VETLEYHNEFVRIFVRKTGILCARVVARAILHGRDISSPDVLDVFPDLLCRRG